MEKTLSPNEQHRVIEAIERIYRRFTSGNDTPVTQARITSEEWDLIKPFIRLPALEASHGDEMSSIKDLMNELAKRLQELEETESGAGYLPGD